jgi:porin
MSALLGVLLASLAVGSPALSADPSGTETSPAVEQLVLKEGWPSGDKLLHLPEWMKLRISVIDEPMANPAGGSDNRASWMGQTLAALELGPGLARSPEQWREIDHWSLRLAVNHYNGDGAYAATIGALFPLQQIAYPNGALLSELSLKRSAHAGRLQIKAGILPLNPSFVSAPVFNNYVHSAFNNTLNISATDLPISPYGSLGGVVELLVMRELSLRYGWFDLSSTATVSRWLGSPALASINGSAQLLQLNWSPASLALPAGTPLPGCRTSGGVVRRTAHCQRPVLVQNQLPGALLSLGGYSTTAAGSGVYGSATLRAGLPIGLDQRLWFGASASSSAPGNLSPGFMGGGLVVQGALPSRPLDLLVLAAGRASLRPGAVTAWPSTYEGMVELGYQLALNRRLALQPTLQWILNPSAGTGPLPDILAASLQLSLSF